MSSTAQINLNIFMTFLSYKFLLVLTPLNLCIVGLFMRRVKVFTPDVVLEAFGLSCKQRNLAFFLFFFFFESTD